MCLGTGSLCRQDRDTGVTTSERLLNPGLEIQLDQPRGKGVSSAVPGPRLKGYHFVVVLKECLDTVSEIVTFLLQREETQCMSNT